MADPRTFVLIGDFQDNITPALQSINNSIAGLKRTMSTMSTRRGGGFSDVTQSVGKLVSAQKHLANSIKEVGDASKTATEELKAYRQAVGKVASAHYHIAKSSQQAGDKIASGYNNALTNLNKLNKQERVMATARRQRMRTLSSEVITPRSSSRSSRPSGISPAMPPGGGGGGGYHRGLGTAGSFDMARFTLTFGLSEAIAAPITSAITAGFQIGVGMMMKPFQYFMNGMQERMQDEMSDLKAASGFFSINRMSEKKFLERGSFQEAIDFMQKNNALMAKLAGSLPGSTQDFIEVNKRISDSIAQLVTDAPERAMALAERIRREETSTAYSSIGPITGPPNAKGMQNAMQILMADLTKQTVLAGQGTGSGMQGAMGAYGLPQLTERMLSQQNISMGQLQRYAAIFKDPMILRNLEKELPKISATMANTPERYEALRKFYERVLPPELVERYRRTLAGVQETFNTAIFSPETGIFGLGRKMKQLGGAFDEFGRMLDENGQVTKDITQQARIDIDLYGLFRDILANLGRVLAPIVENLSSFWDPLFNIGKLLEKARVATMEVLRSFEIYNKSFENFAKTLNPKDLQKFSQTGGKELRASLATIANLFRQFGVISEQDFQGIFDKLVKVDMKGGDIFKELLDKFLKSDVAKQIGEFIGTLIGTVLSEVSKVSGFLSGRIAGTGKLFDGLKKGFDEAGGPAAFANIFKDVFGMMFKGLLEVAKLLPIQVYIVGALMATLPVAIQTLSMILAQRISDGFLGGSFVNKLTQGNFFAKARETYLLDKASGSVNAGKPLTRTGVVSSPSGVLKASRIESNFPVATGMNPPMSMGGPRQAPSIPKPPSAAKGIPVSIQSVAKNSFVKVKGFLGAAQTRLGAGGMAGLKNPMGMLGKVGGIATVGVGIVEALRALLTGSSLGEALGKGAGPIIGTIIGTALLGPLGGVIGGMIGSIDAITQPLGAAFDSIFGTLSTVFEFLGQIGGDLLGIINGFVRMLPNVSKDFDVLRFAITALLSPFRLLELMIIGLYEGYLRLKEIIPGLGLNAEEKAKKDELFRARLEKTAALELDFKQAYNKKARAEYQRELDALKANGKGEQERARIVENALKIIDQKLKEKDPKYKAPTTFKPSGAAPAGATAPSAKPGPKIGYLTKNGVKGWMGTDGTWTPLVSATAPAPAKPFGTGGGGLSKPIGGGAAAAAKEVGATARNTTDLNKKASDQIKKTAETTLAIKTLTQKITGQTSVQTTVAAIYNLLASGSLRVNGMPGMLPGGSAPGRGILPGGSVLPNPSPYNPFLNPGGIFAPQLNGGLTLPNAAFALGSSNPAFFSTQSAAEKWERSMVSGSVKVGSITSNSAEGFGAGANVVNNITINQQPGQDANELAAIVAMKIGEAVADARAASIFV